jgi:hypothetical protein
MTDDRLLSEAEKRDLIELIDRVWMDSPKICPICTVDRWVLADRLTPAPNPSLRLICDSCGYTVHFDAKILGGLILRLP